MSRQHSTPYIVTTSGSQPLKPVHDVFDETWLQKFVFDHSGALPIDEIEPVFGSLIPVCRELRTDAGPVDILFVNADGLLTLVECKLWQNPESRRAVIGQILDYAKELSSWSYEQLEQAVRDSRKDGQSLYQLVAQSSELDEGEFINNASRNLRRGRFLLLIIGSGIRESVESITDFLQRHAHLNFSLTLIEIAIFRLPEQAGSGYLVLPRVVAQTVEIERAILRIEDGRIVAELPAEEGTRSGTRTKISEQAFYEALAKTDLTTSQELRIFLEKAKGLGLSVEPGENSLKLKFISDDIELNLGIFRTNGHFRNRRIALMTERFGHPEIGETYLDRLAALIPEGCVYKHKNKFLWEVRKRDDQNITIAECLAVQDKWLEIIQDTIAQLLSAQEKET